MSLIKKVRAVEKVYYSLEKQISAFQQKSNFKCIENCHFCCTKHDIQANPLEFLPLAYYLYKNQQAYNFLERLEQSSHQTVCVLFNPFSNDGACSFYNYRGLICRLFGFSAMLDKHENKTLITCKLLKTQKSTEFKIAQQLINNGADVPLTSKYYLKLYAIDLKLSAQYYSINDAIKQAIETVLFYFSYRDKKVS